MAIFPMKLREILKPFKWSGKFKLLIGSDTYGVSSDKSCRFAISSKNILFYKSKGSRKWIPYPYHKYILAYANLSTSERCNYGIIAKKCDEDSVVIFDKKFNLTSDYYANKTVYDFICNLDYMSDSFFLKLAVLVLLDLGSMKDCDSIVQSIQYIKDMTDQIEDLYHSKKVRMNSIVRSRKRIEILENRLDKISMDCADSLNYLDEKFGIVFGI